MPEFSGSGADRSRPCWQYLGHQPTAGRPESVFGGWGNLCPEFAHSLFNRDIETRSERGAGDVRGWRKRSDGGRGQLKEGRTALHPDCETVGRGPGDDFDAADERLGNDG